MKDELRINIVQADIVWENIASNLAGFGQRLEAFHPDGDIIVLPEMFTTGFSTNAKALAEEVNGTTIETVQRWAEKYSSLIIGSFIAREQDKFYNRGLLAEPEGKIHFYDKKHLFIGGEKDIFTPGDKQCLINYEGWNIAFCICYDLRFPVWNRYSENFNYDLMVCVAEWPTNRQENFETLLKARAIENQCYLCASNRIGNDENFLHYSGGSQLIDFKGNVLCRCRDNSDEIISYTIKKYPLESNREKFPVGSDADRFEIL